MRKMIVSVALLGLFGAACGTAAAQSGSDEPIAVEASETSVAEAASQAATLTESAMGHLDNSMTYVNAYDLDGAASELDAAGDDFDAQEAVWTGVDDTLALGSADVADSYHSAASNLRSGNIEGATADISSGTSILEGLITYVQGEYNV